MPYTMDNLPEAIQGLPKHAQEIWISAFNSASDQGDSEESCMKIAWSAVKKEYEQDGEGKWHKKKSQAATRRIRGELVALAEGEAASTTKTIQVIRAGEFEDMNGLEVTIKPEDLAGIAERSNAVLAKREIPVEIGHPDDPGAPAAAWYRKFFKKVVDGVEWVCAEVELTRQGAQALADQLYKYFSAEIHLDTLTITGGGFVNRPAVSGQQVVGSLSAYLKPRPSNGAAGQRPGGAMEKPKSVLARIRDAFSQALHIAELEMSQEDLRSKIYKALEQKYRDPMMEGMGMYTPYPVATFEDRVIVGKEDKYFALPYTVNADGDVELGEPQEVEVTWTPKASAGESHSAAMSAPPAAPTAPPVATAPAAPSMTAPTTAPSQAASLSGNNDTPKGGDSAMADPINTPPAAPVTPTVPVTNPLPVATPDPNLTPEQQLAQARTEAQLAAQKQMQEFEARLAEARQSAWADAQAQMARKQAVAALSIKLTTGGRQFPYKSEELEQILVQLSDADRALIAPVLERIHDNGLVEMGERGSSVSGGANPLPEYAKPLLQAWLAKKGTVEEFFAQNPELGAAHLYNLSEFKTA